MNCQRFLQDYNICLVQKYEPQCLGKACAISSCWHDMQWLPVARCMPQNTALRHIDKWNRTVTPRWRFWVVQDSWALTSVQKG